MFTFSELKARSRETEKHRMIISLTGCSLWTEVQLYDTTLYCQNAFLQRKDLVSHTHKHTHTHVCMHIQYVYTHTADNTQAVKETPRSLSERHKNISQTVCLLYICYQTACAEALSSIFLTDLMFRPFALKHTFVSNEWRYNQSLCQCQSQWQNHPLPLLNSTIYYQRKELLNNHSAS